MSSNSIKKLLPIINFDKNDSMTENELFQNSILRPILKYQDSIVCQLTLHFCLQMNPTFNSLATTKQRKMIKEVISGNQILRNNLIGVIISFFDSDDIQFYFNHSKEINKRILAMISVRVLDGYQKHLNA